MTTTAPSKRAVKVREARETLEASIRLLADRMSKGKSEELVRYLEFSAKFHHYSFGNLMLILWQCPKATRVAGLRQWNLLGRHVRAGEKGIMILAPMTVWAKDRRDESTYSEDSPKIAEDPDRQKILIFKPVYVFDVSQTEGKELPALLQATGDVTDCLPALETAIRQAGILLEKADRVPRSESAEGASFGGRIVIRNDLDPAEAFRTLAHEFAHELLHWPKDGRAKEPSDTKLRSTVY